MRFPVFANTSGSPSSAVASNQSVTICASGASWSTGTTNHRSIIPFRCQISLFALEIVTPPGAGKSWTFVLQKNNVDTSLSVTLSGAAATIASTTTESVIFEEDDFISIRATPSGTPAAVTDVRFSFVVDTLGRPEYFYMRSYGTASTGSRAYGSVANSGVTWTTSGAATSVDYDMAHDATITKMKLYTSSLPGAGKTFVYSLYKNGAEEASTQMTIDNSGALTREVTGLSIALSAGDVIKLSSLPSGTPTAGHVSITTVVRPKTVGEYSVSSMCSNLDSPSATAWHRAFMSLNTQNTVSEDNTRHIDPPSFSYALKNYFTRVGAAPGSGKSRAFTITRNGSDTSIVSTISGTATSASDTSHVEYFGPLDNVAMKAVPSGTPTTTNGLVTSIVIYVPVSKMES